MTTKPTVNQIEVRIKDSAGMIKASFISELRNERDLKETMQLIIPWLLNKGTIKALCMELDLDVAGIQFQKSKTK